MKKMIFGIAVAAATLSASAYSTSLDDLEGETVGQIATNQWVIVNALEEGDTWECVSGGTACKGTLNEGATPDSGGYYSDNEVTYSTVNMHFEQFDPVNK